MSTGASRNLILTGFMGTGKSAVAREVARQLGRPFVDMDDEIQTRAGKSIPRIFSEDGEAAFRRQEAALCQELSERQGQVIATGGGALVDADNRLRMADSGTIVCLSSDVNEIMRRVGAGVEGDRPLLDVADPRAEVERLLGKRRAAYAAIPWQINTAGLPVEEVAARVIRIAEVITLPVRHPGGEYPIHIGDDVLTHLGGGLRAAGVPDAGRVAIVSNPAVAALYGPRVEESLRRAGLRPFACLIPDGEAHKTLDTVADLYRQFLAGGLDRVGTVLSLGGGVTGDIAGFAAASFMRGVRFAQAPTTLLSMVDASVGGKTGVDLLQGKNLVGAFKQPELVAIDPSVLETLPEPELVSGMAEVIKHGVIGAPDLFQDMETAARRASQAVPVADRPLPVLHGQQIARALQVKIEVVEEDPYERGRRAVLNLGHTVGHAVEKLSGFQMRHGEAVSIGMVAAARIAATVGRANPALAGRIEETLAGWGLPVRCPPYSVDAIRGAMAHDKKRRGNGLRWILPEGLGAVSIVDEVPARVVSAVLLGLGARRDG
jgi:shikimate kinase/3-dehydroquinate synthase